MSRGQRVLKGLLGWVCIWTQAWRAGLGARGCGLHVLCPRDLPLPPEVGGNGVWERGWGFEIGSGVLEGDSREIWGGERVHTGGWGLGEGRRLGSVCLQMPQLLANAASGCYQQRVPASCCPARPVVRSHWNAAREAGLGTFAKGSAEIWGNIIRPTGLLRGNQVSSAYSDDGGVHTTAWEPLCRQPRSRLTQGPTRTGPGDLNCSDSSWKSLHPGLRFWASVSPPVLDLAHLPGLQGG